MGLCGMARAADPWWCGVFRIFGLLLCVLLIPACQTVAGVELPLLARKAEPLEVLGGAVRVVGPAHYCPDPESLRDGESSAAVLLGKCSAESRATPAVLAVAIGAAGSGAILMEGGATLAEFLTSEPGRAFISRNGRADEVRVETALMAGDVFLLRLNDRAIGDYWRGMISVSGHLVSVSAMGPDLPADQGRKLVEAAVKALQRANAGKAAGNPPEAGQGLES